MRQAAKREGPGGRGLGNGEAQSWWQAASSSGAAVWPRLEGGVVAMSR